MRIYALIPNEIIEKIEDDNSIVEFFQCGCSLTKMKGELHLVIHMKDKDGKTINGIQLIGEIK